MSDTPMTPDPNRIALGPQTAELIANAIARHRQLLAETQAASADLNRLFLVAIESSGRSIGERWNFEPGDDGAFLVRVATDSPPPAPRLVPRDEPPDAPGSPVPDEPTGPHNPEPAAAPAAGG